MHLVVDIKDFKERLEVIENALDQADADPIAGHYLFRVGPDSVEILGGHDSTGLCGFVKLENIAPTNVAEGETVEFTCEGKRLKGFLGAAGKGNIGIDYNADTKEITLKPEGVNAEFTTNGLNPSDSFNFESDFTKAKANGGQGTFTGDSLDEAFDVTSPFVGQGLAQAGYSLVSVASDDEGCMIRAADGKSVAVYRHSGMTGTFDLRGDKVNAVRNFLKRAGGDVTLYDGDSYYFFEDDSGDYFGFKKVDYSFPDLSSIKPFDTDIKTVVKVDREVLKAAVTRLKWSLDDDQRRMGFEIQGESDCTLRLFTKNTKGAVSEETVDDGVLRTAGKDDVEFYVNYEYILKGLSKFPVDVVTLYIHKSRGFSYVKMLTDKADGDSTISQALLLALMKKPKG